MRLKIHTPGLRDMTYRQQLLAQPETMAYNRGRDMGGAPGYHPDTGCIDFPMEDWRYWRQVWLLNEPQFFSALLKDEVLGCFVGEVTYYYDGEAEAHIAGILIEARHRGRGYCAEGLRALMAHAFAREDIAVLRADLPEGNAAAIAGYRRAGFHYFGARDGQRLMLCTREAFERMGKTIE